MLPRKQFSNFQSVCVIRYDLRAILMAAPRVFVSSTCYDLRYIRENLRFFIPTLGYEPVLSEQGGVFYDPALHVQDACLAVVPTCQLFIRIVGGRFGSQYKSHTTSF